MKNGKVEITFAELEQRVHERGETIIGYYRPSVLLRERGVVQASRLSISMCHRHLCRRGANVYSRTSWGEMLPRRRPL